MRPTRALIDLKKMSDNITNLRALTSTSTSLMAVVKGEGYGHGASIIARKALQCGATHLGVALPEEGATLREEGLVCPIVVLGTVYKEQCCIVANYQLSQAVSSLETAQWLQKEADHLHRKLGIHIKLDTGMGRVGIRELDELKDFLIGLDQYKQLHIEGVFTHFAAADDEDATYTHNQLDKFHHMLTLFYDMKIDPGQIHAANSAGIINFPSSHFDLVRAGISIYGYYPSSNFDRKKVTLYPILQWESRVVFIKTLPVGEGISYGRAFITTRTSRVATIPVGYADGYNRLLGNRGWVLIRGCKAPVVGRVCMDQIIVDITDIPDTVTGDPVVLIGTQGSQTITADDLADLCGTISYEILTGISSRVPRVYLDEHGARE